MDPSECTLAYVFKAQGKARDLETIYQFGNSSDAKSNVIFREWLTDWQLWLYFRERHWATSFEEPVFPLLLGRQQELAHVEQTGGIVQEVELEASATILQGTVIPFPNWQASGMVMALPLAMSPDLPRQAVGVRPWQLIGEETPITAPDIWHDPDLSQGVCFVGG